MNNRIGIEKRINEIFTQAGGVITPRAVVDDARNSDSPLHECFDWNDEIAGDKWRLVQARRLIRSVTIKTVIEHHTIAAPCYTRDVTSEPGKQGYVSVISVKSNYEKARDTLRTELTRIEGIITRAQAVAAVLGLDSELQDELENIISLRERVEIMNHAPSGSADLSGIAAVSL